MAYNHGREDRSFWHDILLLYLIMILENLEEVILNLYYLYSSTKDE